MASDCLAFGIGLVALQVEFFHLPRSSLNSHYLDGKKERQTR